MLLKNIKFVLLKFDFIYAIYIYIYQINELDKNKNQTMCHKKATTVILSACRPHDALTTQNAVKSHFYFLLLYLCLVGFPFGKKRIFCVILPFKFTHSELNSVFTLI